MTAQWMLGFEFDIVHGIPTVADLAAGNNTGKRVHMRNYDVLGILFYKNAASAGTDNIVITLNEHTAASGGSSQVLAGIQTYYIKSTAAALTGAETWTEVDNTSGGLPQSTLTLTGAAQAANQLMVYFDVSAAKQTQQSGYQWMSISIADPGSAGTIVGGLFYIMGGLHMQRRPDLLVNPNA